MTRVILYLLCGLFFSTTTAQIKNFIDRPYLESSAKSDTLVIPDRIYISIVLSEEDSKGKYPLEALEIQMEMALKEANVNVEKDLSVNGIQSNYSSSFLRGKDIRKKKEFTLLVTEAKTASQVLISLEKYEISNTRISSVRHSKSDLIRTELRIRALKKAKKRAQLMADALGQSIGSAILVTQKGPSFSNPSNVAYDNTLYAYVEKSSPTIQNVEFNKIKFTQSVQVTFTLLP